MSHFPSNEFRIPLFFQGHQTWEVVSVIPRLLGYLPHPCHQLKHLHRKQVLSLLSGSIGQTWEVVSVIPRLLGYLPHPCHQLKHLHRKQVLSQGFLLGAAIQDWLVWS